jgi:hypothetical protein
MAKQGFSSWSAELSASATPSSGIILYDADKLCTVLEVSARILEAYPQAPAHHPPLHPLRTKGKQRSVFMHPIIWARLLMTGLVSGADN